MKLFIVVLSVILLSGCGYSSKWAIPIKENDVEKIESNLNSGADPDEVSEVGNTPLLLAVHHNKPQIVKRLLSAGAKVDQRNSEGQTPLFIATSWFYDEVVEELIKGGADVNAKDPSGLTALHWMGLKTENYSLVRAVRITKLLLAGGADIYAVNQTGGMVLHSALDPQILEIILKHGGSEAIGARDDGGRTPLFHQTDAASIKLLLDSGAQASVLDNMGLTPLHMQVWLVSQNNWPISTLSNFLSANIDPNVKNNWGMTPLEYARSFGNPAVVNTLESYTERYSDPLSDFYNCGKAKSDTAKSTCYSAFIKKHPDSKQRGEAIRLLASVNQKIVSDKKRARQRQQANQACKLKNDEWLYLSQACKGAFAHGNGVATNDDKQLRFVGEFKYGQRVKGEIYAYGKLMYDGPLKDERPHGTGTCIHEGEPEECKYYKGKRTDVLYKQRIEFAKQRELLASTEKRINDSLKETESNIDKKLANIQTGSGNVSQGNSATDMVTEALKKKAADKAADFLFDQLF